jgi:LPS-assembly protein
MLAGGSLAVAIAPESAAQAQGLRLQRALTPLDAVARERAPLFVSGDRVEARGEDEVEVAGRAELRRGGSAILAERLTYFTEQGEVEAEGSVRLLAPDGDELRGPRLRFRVDDQIGVMNTPTFTLAPRPRTQGAVVTMRGDAQAVRFEGEERYRVSDGRFTSCAPGDDSWFMSASEIDLDMDADRGVARGARLTFKGLTTPRLPEFGFPLSNQRKTGFLPPTIGLQGKVGTEILVPFYLNLAPNRDATITPRYMTQRGLQLLTEGRYLDRNYQGIVRYEYLPKDLVRGESRYGMSLVHNYADPANGRSGIINYNRVSDDNYFRDLSGRLSIATQLFLPQEAAFNFAVPHVPGWTITTRTQRYQTLQDVNNPVLPPYDRPAQVVVTGLTPTRFGTDFGFSGEGVAFDHPTLPLGRRLIAYPSMSLPFLRPQGYITPKVGLHMTHYGLSRLDGATDPLVSAASESSLTRTLPIASLDSGLVFERDLKLGNLGYVNTLEPRLYYLYVPYRNQERIPLFDTAVADFNYAQIFSENYFVGGDRISDANQLTFALTSRLIRSDTGQETLRALFGQRFYFSDRRVNLNSTTAERTDRLSSYLFGLSGIVYPRVIADATVQIASADRSAERLNVGVRYQPELGKVLNVAYRYTTAALNPIPNTLNGVTQELRQIDVSGQWPLSGRWYAIGRYNYSIPEKQATELLAGLEYNGGCWILRTVMQRFATATGTQTNLFFVQLELNGFSRIGSNPLEALRRNIPGYSLLNRTNPGGQAFDFASENEFR